jgi:hypothetical protein
VTLEHPCEAEQYVMTDKATESPEPVGKQKILREIKLRGLWDALVAPNPPDETCVTIRQLGRALHVTRPEAESLMAILYSGTVPPEMAQWFDPGSSPEVILVDRTMGGKADACMRLSVKSLSALGRTLAERSRPRPKPKPNNSQRVTLRLPEAEMKALGRAATDSGKPVNTLVRLGALTVSKGLIRYVPCGTELLVVGTQGEIVGEAVETEEGLIIRTDTMGMASKPAILGGERQTKEETR